jgi:hypothetical protein
MLIVIAPRESTDRWLAQGEPASNFDDGLSPFADVHPATSYVPEVRRKSKPLPRSIQRSLKLAQLESMLSA